MKAVTVLLAFVVAIFAIVALTMIRIANQIYISIKKSNQKLDEELKKERMFE